MTLDAYLAPLGLEPAAEQALAVREALTNVLRHARARHCYVRVERTPAAVRVVVLDDGIGSTASEGAGLSGMRARLAALGGEMRRDGTRGTRIELLIPVRRDAAAPEAVHS